MAVDKNLFIYDLAVVSTLYNESHYVKEWIDYHLSAGVDHFYIYDHESTDNMKEILQPYINAGIVTYTFFPGKAAIFPIYTDALEKYKFFCRYISFIDGDEFIFPQENKSIVEVADEIFYDKPQAGGLAVNWHCFGSGGNKKADFSRGVLERFLYRASNDYEKNCIVKDIVNPRRIDFFDCPHKMNYFENYFSVNEDGGLVFTLRNFPITDKKIVINHYYVKSFEEYMIRSKGGDAAYNKNSRLEENFNNADRNEIFDDSILKYYENRMNGGGAVGRQINYQRLYNALLQNLASTFVQNVPTTFYQGKMESFLTCWKLAEYLREKILDKNAGRLFEEAALNSVYRTLQTNISIADLRLLFKELPNILTLNYPVIKDIRTDCINLIQKLMIILRNNIGSNYSWNIWNKYAQLNNFLNMLKAFDSKK